MAKNDSTTQGRVRNPHSDNGSSSHNTAGRQRFLNSEPLAAFILAGKTGSGKSSFIKLLGGRDLKGQEPTVSGGLESCTQKPTVYLAMVGDRKIVLLDTPGFDDSGVENIEILNDIAANLHTFSLQKHEIETRGVIFLHDISETRFGGSQKKTLEILKALCGPKGMKNCIIGSTMWNNPGSPRYRAEETRESEFLRKHWQGIFKTTRIQENDRDTVIGIINDILTRPPTLLLIQEEMLRPPHTLESTTVGKIAIPEGQAEAKRLRQEFEDHQRQSREEAQEREAEHRRQVEEERVRFEEARAKERAETKRREEEQQRRIAEQQRQHQEEIRKMDAEHRKRAEEDAERQRKEDKRRREQEKADFEGKMAERLREYQAIEEERQRKFNEEQRKREEEAARMAKEERDRLDREREEFMRTKVEPEPVPWWKMVVSAIETVAIIALGGPATKAIATAIPVVISLARFFGAS